MDFAQSAGHATDRGWAQRLQEFLKRVNVTVGAGPVSARLSGEEVSAEALGISVGIDLKEELKSSQPFVQELRESLGFYLGDLRREVGDHCQELVRAHLESRGGEGVVMVLDSLEKIRGTTANDERVQESVKRALVQHAEKLRFDSHHMVYTVPPYLLFTDPGSLPYEDLFRILRELIMLLNARKVPLPATQEQVAEAIDKIGFGFSSITAEDAAFLRWVHEAGGDIRPEQQHVGRLARLLHSHMVLAHLNGGLWYEVHPLARRALGLG